jgi:hypothetical protein
MNLTVIPDDKAIYLETIEFPFPNRRCHIIDDVKFWNDIDKDIHAIQYHDDGQKEIEYKISSGKGNVPITDISILQVYIDKFNLTEQIYQASITAWDNNNIEGETRGQKIFRLGPRP